MVKLAVEIWDRILNEALNRRGAVDRRTLNYWNSYFAKRPAAWITPDNEVHPLEGTTHGVWVERHLDIVGKHATPPNPTEMLRKGWIQKADKHQYRVWSKRDLGRILAHVKHHHPEVGQVEVDIENPTEPESMKLPVNEADLLIFTVLSEMSV